MKSNQPINQSTNKLASTPKFPSNVLMPVAHFLTARLHTLEKRKKEIAKEDPFADSSRVDDNAAPDTEAGEQFGHARTSAIKTEITKSIIGIRKALTMIKLGKYGICEECGQMIDTARLVAFPEATLCATDAKKKEK
jgi:RNA polymerase-binding transcription factor DksA